MKTINWIFVFFICTNILFGQVKSVPLTKIGDNIKCSDQKEVPVIIANKAELDALLLPSALQESLLKNIDFTTDNIAFVCFYFGGPGTCTKTYFDYFLDHTNSTQVIKVNIHAAASEKPMYINSVALKIPKTYHLDHVSFNKVYIKYLFKSKTDLDSICHQLSIKYKP